MWWFRQEFKREKKSANDPEAQMLAAMVAAKEINKDNQPIYGSYIIGRNWFFGVLKDNDYAISNAYNATETEDLSKIIFILRALKQVILANLKHTIPENQA